MDYHSMSIDSVLKSLETNKDGLKNSELQNRYKKYGQNILKTIKQKSKLTIFLSQFNSLLIYILIVAAVVSALVGHIVDSVVIGIIIILNGTIGFVQEFKAGEIIEKLKKSLDYKATVFRDGRQIEISSKMIVPGDIIIYDSGDKILADCRIIESDNLKTNEAALTGESFPVEKTSEKIDSSKVLAERRNMLYAGTIVVSGKAKAVVVNTGGNAEFGKLAELVQETEDEKMPLEKKLDRFSRNISIAVLIFVGLIFLLGLYMGLDRVEMFMIAISLAIGAIPEGLPAIIAITLAVAIKQMHKTNTLIRKLPAAETLGRATVICTDKTGTLTEEELTVDQVFVSKFEKVDSLKRNFQVDQLLKISVLCNNARDEKDDILGDPTEISLIKFAKKFNLSKKELTEKNPRVLEFDFDSHRKMMSIIRSDGKFNTSYVKGASIVVLDKCTKELVGNKIRIIDNRRRRELVEKAHEMERQGLRVLAFAFRKLSSTFKESNSREANIKIVENNLVFVGFCGMIDPPRKEVAQAIKEALSAGIKIKIITGDAALTTQAIARKIGLVGDAIEGKELENLSDHEWHDIVKTKTIFARVTPRQKLKVINILKSQNETVAVTGDGVNDILALKRADIGIAMGVRGSDVARDSSDMVLLDDNFASIIGAVNQGRRVSDNMKKSIKFLLAANAGEVLVVAFGLFLGWPLIFLPLAILWINLVTDSLPALALAVEPASKGIMKRKPSDDNLLFGIWKSIILAGILMVSVSLWIFNYGLTNFDLAVARTMAISSAIFFELFFAFSCKSDDSLFRSGIFNNKYLLYAILISAGLHLLAVYTVVGNVFGFVALSGLQLGLSVLIGLSGLIVFEIWKGFRIFSSRN